MDKTSQTKSRSKESDIPEDDLIASRKARRRQEMLDTDIGDWGSSLDPVKMYLRRIGQVKLLTREGEVAIAKEIEAGREQIFDELIRCEAGVEMILALPDRLKAGTARAREVFDEYEPSAEDSELPVAPEVFKRFDKVKRAQKSVATAKDKVDSAVASGDEESITKAERSLERAYKKMDSAVRECLLSQRFYNEVVVEGSVFERNLPRSIEAVYLHPGHSTETKTARVAAHARLLRHFHVGAESLPLLVFNASDWTTPFREYHGDM